VEEKPPRKTPLYNGFPMIPPIVGEKAVSNPRNAMKNNALPVMSNVLRRLFE
jgi:hypothetical protein